MKKIVLLLTAALLLHLLPAHATAEFYLKVNRTGQYTVQFADQNQTTPSSQFRFHDLMAGVCTFKVIDNYSHRVIYSGTVTLSDGYRTVAELDNYGTLRVVQNIQVRQAAWYMDEYPNYYAYGNGSYNNTNNWNDPYGQCGTGTGTNWNNQNTYYWGNNNSNGWSNGTNNGWSSNNGSNWSGNNNTGWGSNNVTDDNTFRSLKDYVSRQSFDSNKLSAAKEVTRNNRFKAAQVAELCKLFSFDDNRLDYAKYAYDYVTDKGNYYLVSNTFTFSSNADELRNYTASH